MGSTEQVFPARPEMLAEIRAFVAELATVAGIGDPERHRIVLVTNEAATNAVQHSGSDVVRVGHTRLSERGVSHLSDNVILLQYLRRDATLSRAVTVLKTRALSVNLG